MKTYNQFLETPFSEEIKPPEPQEEDPDVQSKEKRQKQIKKMVLLKKLQAVRAGAGADIVASYEPEGELVEGKYKAVTNAPDSLAKMNQRYKPVKKKEPTDTPFRDRLKANRGVKEGTDKAFEYVKKQIAAKYGKSGYVSKDNPRKPQSAADKAKARAHQAKVDKENAAARAKDPSQGRYPKG